MSRDEALAARLFDTWERLGRAQVPWKHQPPLIKRAIRAARMRPMLKDCFMNAQTLVLGQHEVPLTYVEGLVSTSALDFFPIEHAWVRLDGVDVELTVTHDQPKILTAWEVSTPELRSALARSGVFGPFDTQRLAHAVNNHWLKLIPDLRPTIETQTFEERRVGEENRFLQQNAPTAGDADASDTVTEAETATSDVGGRPARQDNGEHQEEARPRQHRRHQAG